MSESADIDPSGRIGIEVDIESAEGKCGEIVQVLFTLWLDSPNPKPGWLVQKVTFKCKTAVCDDCPLEKKPNPDVEEVFFEAIKVAKSEPRTIFGARDESSGQCVPDSCGMKYKQAEARFYPEDVIGDLSKTWKKGGEDLGKDKCLVNPGKDAIWIKEEPEWWEKKKKSPLGRVGTRTTTILWMCCPCESESCKITATAKPKPVKGK